MNGGPNKPRGRDRVMSEAAALFVQQGYAATSLRQIAEAVQIKAASIYHHFDSKEDLFGTVLNQGIAVMVDAFERAAALDQPMDDQIKQHVRAHLGALFEHGPFTAAHVTAFFTAPPPVRAAAIPARDGYEKLWNDLLRVAFADLSDSDVHLHRLILFGAMNTTIEWFDPKGTLTLDQLADAIATQFLTGVTS